jgi:enoyl-CoA hydratase/carnithine racemase
MRDTMLHARRWKGGEAVERGFCDVAVAGEELVLAEAIRIAAAHAARGANRKVYSQLKTQMWPRAKEALTEAGTTEGLVRQSKQLGETLAAWRSAAAAARL